MTELLTTREAAERLGVGPTSIKRWADAGLLRAVRTLGGHRRYALADILALRSAGEPPPASAAMPLYRQIAGLSRSALDGLPLGVVELDAEGRVLFYNATEARLSGMAPADVLGRHFFGDVAPCTSNGLVQGRFADGVRRGELDLRIRYTFTYRMRPTPVMLHLYLDAATGTYWFLVEVDPGQPTPTAAPLPDPMPLPATPRAPAGLAAGPRVAGEPGPKR